MRQKLLSLKFFIGFFIICSIVIGICNAALPTSPCRSGWIEYDGGPGCYYCESSGEWAPCSQGGGNYGTPGSSSSNPDCPSGTYYDASQDACIMTVVEGCPTGYHTDSDGSCVSNNNPSCPSGTTWDSVEQACIKTTIVCPDGYTFDSQQSACIPADKGCYPGSTWDSVEQACLSDSCPYGTTWSDADNACVAWIQGKCPIGYHEDSSGNCIPDVSVGDCYPGSTWDPAENACVADSCPEGTTWSDADNACVHTSVMDCPEGDMYDAAQDACVPTSGPECPSGSTFYAPEQSCVSCSEGSTLDSTNGNCVTNCPIKGGSVDVEVKGAVLDITCPNTKEGKPQELPVDLNAVKPVPPGLSADDLGKIVADNALLPIKDAKCQPCAESGCKYPSSVKIISYGGSAIGKNGEEIVQQVWDLGDGSYSEGAGGVKVYGEPGTFQPVFHYVDQCGDDKTASGEPVTVEKPCSASGSWKWSSTADCIPNADGSKKCEIKNTVTETGDLKVTSLLLDYGDGTPPEEVQKEGTVTHTFTKPGCYILKMTITDQCNEPQTSSYTGDPICVCEKGLIYDESQKKCVVPPTITTPTAKKTPKVIVVVVTPIIKPVTSLSVINKVTRPPIVTPTPKKFVVITKISTKVVKPGTQLTVVKKTPTGQTQTIKTPTKLPVTGVKLTPRATKLPGTGVTLTLPPTKIPTIVPVTPIFTRVTSLETPTPQVTKKKFRVITKVVTKKVKESGTLKVLTQTIKPPIKTNTPLPLRTGTIAVISTGKSDLGITVTKDDFDNVIKKANVNVPSDPSDLNIMAPISWGPAVPLDIVLTSGELTALMQTTNAKGPLKNIQIKILPDGSLEMISLVDLSKYGLKVMGQLYAKGTFERMSDNTIKITLTEGTIAGVPIPKILLGQIEKFLDKAINDQLKTMSGLKITTLTFMDGKLTYSGMFPQSVSLKSSSTSLTGTVKPSPTETQVLNVWSISTVKNNPKDLAKLTITKPLKVTKIQTYHWNDGKGATPGSIMILDTNKKVLGTWQATGESGNNNVQNAAWNAVPNFDLQPGTYYVKDTSPETWSWNSDTNNQGMTKVWGVYKTVVV